MSLASGRGTIVISIDGEMGSVGRVSAVALPAVVMATGGGSLSATLARTLVRDIAGSRLGPVRQPLSHPASHAPVVYTGERGKSRNTLQATTSLLLFLNIPGLVSYPESTVAHLRYYTW